MAVADSGQNRRADKPAGVILAGGRSSRMGIPSKALVALRGQPLLSHVISRLQPQLGALLLSSGGMASELEGFGLPMVPDLLPSHRGPLMGLYSALQYLADKGEDGSLVLCPCDAPFVPADLVKKLLDSVQGDEQAVAVISYAGALQPTFSLWQTRHLPVIHRAVVDKGQGGLKQVLVSLPYTIVEWPPAEPPPFFNVNTPAELETANEWLDR